MQKGQGLIFIIVGILVIGLIAGGIYYLGKNSSNPQKKVACTDDAKICPDGSAVGRVYPNCEFAECPNEKDVLIESIQYNPDCSVKINLNSTERDINIGKDKTCSAVYPAQISSNRKFGAFELWLLAPLEPGDTKLFADNTIVVYFADKKNWAKVYQFGAAEVAKMIYDDDNNLKVTLLYEGKETNEIKIRVPEIEKKFDQVVDPITHELNSAEPFW